MISFRFGPLVMTVALVMTLAMGVFGGMFPALRAVRLDVISALRECKSYDALGSACSLSSRMLEDDDRPLRRQRRSGDLDRACPGPLDDVAGQHLQKSFERLDVEVDLGCLVVHGQDDSRSDGVEQGGNFGKVDRRRPAGGRQHDVGPSERRQLRLGEGMAEVAQEHEVQVLRAKMDDRHFVFGQALGTLENMDRLKPNAADDRSLRR